MVACADRRANGTGRALTSNHDPIANERKLTETSAVLPVGSPRTPPETSLLIRARKHPAKDFTLWALRLQPGTSLRVVGEGGGRMDEEQRKVQNRRGW